jgi:DNA-binding LacI/PurR family transcriptional regulator
MWARRSAAGDDIPYVYERFLDDLRGQEFNALIAVALGWDCFADIEVDVHVPTVRVSTVTRYSDVLNDFEAFEYEALTWAARHGARDIVCFGVSDEETGHGGLRRAADQYHLPMPAIEPIGDVNAPDMESAAYRRAQAMIDRWAARGRRPQALIVGDDVAMRAVALALIQRGVRVPEDLLVMTLANEGVPVLHGIPVARYEFSPAENARVALQLLDRRMNGDPVPERPVRLPGRIVENVNGISSS